jgi:hypothetical protein
MRGRTALMSKRMLRQLAQRGDVKRVHYDRPVEALLGRSSITVGAKTVQRLMGYTGAGIGVAVIDSGVTPNHEDLRYAGSYPRVTKFGLRRRPVGPLRRLGPRHAWPASSATAATPRRARSIA